MSNLTAERYPADATDEIHLNAYNAAFYELGLRWYWDADTYEDLKRHATEQDRLCIYLQTRQPHLLKAYDAAFLIEAIQAAKTRCYDTMKAGGGKMVPRVDWAAIQTIEIGI
jgi:hypothetical protein